jgi:hypothetical protein
MERLIKEGTVRFYSAKEVEHSPIGIGFEKLDRDIFDPNKAYSHVAELGVKRVRIQSGWMKTESEEGVYNFAWLDEIVDKLIANNLKPWLNLSYGNPIYTDLAKPVFGAVGCPPIATEREKKAWLDYVEATVEHFKGRIDLYEIWNEPDLSYSWRHCENEELDRRKNSFEYAEFAKATAKVIREMDPEAKIAACTLGSLQHLFFVNNAFSTGLYKYIDYVSFHLYSTNDFERCNVIRSLAKLVESYDPRIKLIQGESGVQSRSDGNGAMHGFAWSIDKQVKLLLRMLISDLAAGVEFASYFSTMDMIEALRGRVGSKATYLDYGYFGVVSADFDEDGKATGEYRRKPSYYALATLASLVREGCERIDIPYVRHCLSSIRMNGTDCTDNTLVVHSFKFANGDTAFFYWNATNILTSTYEGTISFSIFGQNTENVRLIDMRDGTIYKFPEEMYEDRGRKELFLKNIPITDFPMAILFKNKE